MIKGKQSAPIPANLTEQAKKSAIVKIERKINKLSIFDVDSINQQSEISILENEIDTLLHDIFGANTVEYYRYKDITHFGLPIISFRQGPSVFEIRKNITEKIKIAIAMLQSIRDGFIEDISDIEIDKPSKVLRAYNGLQLHRKIAEAADQLFSNCHYANAVEDAGKSLVLYVKEKSGIIDEDGSSLMQRAFSAQNPVLKVSSLPPPTDKQVQQGYMYLFTGAVQALRNPRAHLLVKDDPERALEFIAFISFLAKVVEESIKV